MLNKREKEMIHEMYGAYLIQCGFLNRLRIIHEEWSRSSKRRRDVKRLLDKVNASCQEWYTARVAKRQKTYNGKFQDRRGK